MMSLPSLPDASAVPCAASRAVAAPTAARVVMFALTKQRNGAPPQWLSQNSAIVERSSK